MSLKTFHIFFIIIATLLSAICGLWGVGQYRQTQSAGPLVFAIVSFLAVAILIVYGVWFLRKLKKVSYI